MITKQIKLSNQSKDRLSRLKGKTGIKNWNVLCRDGTMLFSWRKYNANGYSRGIQTVT